MTDFYEDDEPIEEIRAAWEAGEKGHTRSSRFTVQPGEFHTLDCAFVAYVRERKDAGLGIIEQHEGAPPCDCGTLGRVSP